jgi:hypothetical protein
MPQLWQISKVFGVMFGVNFGFRVSASRTQATFRLSKNFVIKTIVRSQNSQSERSKNNNNDSTQSQLPAPLHTMATPPNATGRTPQQNKVNLKTSLLICS